MANRRELTDRILSITGVVVAACALIVTFYQVHLMRDQAKISVWPHIEQYNTTSASEFQRVISNEGLGPAVIRYLSVTVDGKSVKNWRAAVIRLINEGPDPKLNFMQSDLPPGAVLLQGKKRTVIQIMGAAGGYASQHWKSLVIRVCYCSLYGQCWMNRSGSSVDQRVPHCPNGLKSGFYAGREKGSVGKPSNTA